MIEVTELIYARATSLTLHLLYQVGQWYKESSCSAGSTREGDSIPGLGRFPGEGNGNPLQYFCLGNPMDRRTWWATVHGVAEGLDTTQQLNNNNNNNPCRAGLYGHGTAFSFYSKSNRKSLNTLYQRNGRMKSTSRKPPWLLGGKQFGELQEYNQKDRLGTVVQE